MVDLTQPEQQKIDLVFVLYGIFLGFWKDEFFLYNFNISYNFRAKENFVK